MEKELFKRELVEVIDNDEEQQYEEYVKELLDNGYIDFDGNPIKCQHCGSDNLTTCDYDIGGYNIPEGCVTGYTVYCNDCEEGVATWSFGSWEYRDRL